MWRSSSASSVSASAALRGSLRALLIATVMAPAAATAQQTSNAAPASGAVTLPEIRVIATTPVAPPRPPPRPPPRRWRRCEMRRRAQATPAPAEPGVIDRDKVPSNVQTMSATDFDHAKAPSLLDSLERGRARRFARRPDRQSIPAGSQLSRLRRLAGHRHAARARGLSERRAHQRSLRRHRQLGLHPGKRHQPDDAGSQQSDLRPQCASAARCRSR